MGSSKDNHRSLDEANKELLQEAEVLIWSLLDEEIETGDIQRLEGLLKENEQVRQQYISCVQMHTDLIEHFGADQGTPLPGQLPKSPVLGSLGDLRPGSGFMPPVAE